jgi:predicted amidohydrolase YtcJ
MRGHALPRRAALGIVRAIVLRSPSMRIALSLVVALLLISVARDAAAQGVLVNARIHTMNPARPLANAVAWDREGRIVAIRTEADAAPLKSDGALVDAGGRTVVPGLIDAHGHLMNLGFSLLRADLVGTASKDEVLQRLREFERGLPEGAWLLGRGWDQNDWPVKDFPTAADLDGAFPARPVWLERVDGHAGWGNSAAMSAADRRFEGDWQPEGGRILRAQGRATGVFVDEAMKLVESAVPPPTPELQQEALQRALAAAVKLGLTGVHDAGVRLDELELYRRFADAGRLPLRITAMADGDHAALAALCAMGRYAHAGGRLQMRTVKLYLDGALGSRGAAMLDDYSDEPGHRGLLVTELSAFEAAVRKARDCGIQVASHAIGDRGNRLVLDTYEKALGDAAGSDHRWRVEHAQIVALDDVPRFAALRTIASMQPTHATSDMPWAEARVGPHRLAGAYAWQRLLHSGARLALGSDFPVEQVDPMLGLAAAVTRQDETGHPPGGWLPDQRLSAYEALRGFTLDAAYAGFAETDVGSLEVGKRADFVILERDPLAIAPSRLRGTTVHATYVDGVAVHGPVAAASPSSGTHRPP